MTKVYESRELGVASRTEKQEESKRLSNRDFAKHLESRTRRFAVSIIRLSEKLPNTPETRVLKTQLTKAGTSVGANYREANRARSRADFKSKVKICEGEASETQYWLEVIVEAGWLSGPEIQAVYTEGSELLAVFSSIGKATSP